MISRQSRNLASNTYCTIYKLCPAQEAKKAQQRLEASLRQEAVLEPAAIYTHYKQSTHVAACSGGTSGLVPRLCLGRRRGRHALEARSVGESKCTNNRQNALFFTRYRTVSPVKLSTVALHILAVTEYKHTLRLLWRWSKSS